MKRTTLGCAGIALAVMVGIAGNSAGAVIVTQDGTTGKEFFNWTATEKFLGGAPAGTLDVGDGGGGVPVPGNNNAGRIEANLGSIPGFFSDQVYTTSGAFMTFLHGAKSMTLDFYSSTPLGQGGLQLYLYGNNYVWYSDVGALSSGWGNHFTVNFLTATTMTVDASPFGYWYSNDRTDDLFAGDLANATRLGFELTYVPETDGQMYGFDNLNLYDQYFVPEPQTYVVLGFALLSLGVVFRRQFHTLVGAKAVASR